MIYPWHKIPDDIRADMLPATTGWRHLLDLAVRVFESAEQSEEHRAFLIGLGSGLITASWEEDPLALHLVTQLQSVDKALAHLPPPVRAVLDIVKQRIALPGAEQAAALDAATSRLDYDALIAAVDRGMRDDPHNLFWIYIGARAAFGDGRFTWLQQRVLDHPALPEPIRDGLLADSALLRGDPGVAATLYEDALARLPLLLWRERMGYALHRLGRTDEALAAWATVLTERPWHVQLWLVRDSVRRGLDAAGDFPDGPGAVLLYTWNGGEKIDLTLQALSEAQWPEDARILVADNGSTDGRTPAVLAAWAQRFGGRLRVVRMPCNIGAPAVRNWLLTEPESRQAEWLAYLDDDLLVPADWLRRFGTVMRAMPDHGVYGCAVLRHSRPWCFQGADMHLLPPSQAAGPGMPKAPVHMQAANWAEEQNNFGQFGYSRPCVHVAGCCHLFRRASMDRAGMFDVRFSPSQVDDFEHDIRMFSQGDVPCYHGSLAVRHMHATGLTTAQSLPKAMNAYANHLKLQSLYPRQQFDILRERNLGILLQDIVRRQR